MNIVLQGGAHGGTTGRAVGVIVGLRGVMQVVTPLGRRTIVRISPFCGGHGDGGWFGFSVLLAVHGDFVLLKRRHRETTWVGGRLAVRIDIAVRCGSCGAVDPRGIHTVGDGGGKWSPWRDANLRQHNLGGWKTCVQDGCTIFRGKERSESDNRIVYGNQRIWKGRNARRGKKIRVGCCQEGNIRKEKRGETEPQ